MRSTPTRQARRTVGPAVASLTLAWGALALPTAGAAPADDVPTPPTPASTDAATVPATTPAEHTGTLPDGATWRAVVPANWNGTLLLFGHGYSPSFLPVPNTAQLAPGAGIEQALLAEGYALAGSSYSRKGWTLATAAQDQIDALAAATQAIGRAPARVLAYGMSMGGLVTGQVAERAPDTVDGALALCGLMAGGVGLGNHQLDGAHAIDQLLAPDADLHLVGYASLDQASAAARTLTAAVDAGQQTPQGRARVALAAALFHLPHVRVGQAPPARRDWEAMERAQYEWLRDTLSFVVPGRFDIESAVGGNASWNVGVDYRRLFRLSADRRQVEALYQAAGLDLGTDLDRLSGTAHTEADPAAVERLRATSTASGRLDVPVLTLHTTSDNLAPVQFEEDYREEVKRSGRASQLRQAYVDRPGHCAFTSAEVVAGIHALDERVTTGRWRDVATWPRLDAAAEALNLGGAEFVAFRPGEFRGDRGRGRGDGRHDADAAWWHLGNEVTAS